MLKDDLINVDTLLIVKLNYVVRIFYIKEVDIVYNVKRELKNVVLTLLIYIDYIDYIKDKITIISSLLLRYLFRNEKIIRIL